jgi:hypothetical protein
LDTNGIASHHFPRHFINPTTDLPALVAIRDGMVVSICKNLHGLVVNDDESNNGDNDDDVAVGGVQVLSHVVLHWLDRTGILRDIPTPPMDKICYLQPQDMDRIQNIAALSSVSMDHIENNKNHPSKVAQEQTNHQRRYNCGVPGCCKEFRHEHVGITNEIQSGTIVSTEEILGKGM